MSKLGALHIIKPTGAKHTATVIFFHGSGSNGQDMKEWIQIMVKNFTFPHVKVLFPTAPLQPYTPMDNELSNVWFDRSFIGVRAPEQTKSIIDIKPHVMNLIKQENEDGIPTNRIIAGGFSMGGALSFYTGYSFEKNIAGVIAFSSFLNENSMIYENLKAHSKDTNWPPFLQLHGTSDDLVPLEAGKSTYTKLTSYGLQGQFHVLEALGHSINQRGMRIVKEWIEKILPDI